MYDKPFGSELERRGVGPGIWRMDLFFFAGFHQVRRVRVVIVGPNGRHRLMQSPMGIEMLQFLVVCEALIESTAQDTRSCSALSGDTFHCSK